MTESWRPETGHIVFGAEGEDFLAWLISVPMGKVTATYRIGTEFHESTGLGYHDHNWCNQPYMQMGHMLDHWFWDEGVQVLTRSSRPTSRPRRSMASCSYPLYARPRRQSDRG